MVRSGWIQAGDSGWSSPTAARSSAVNPPFRPPRGGILEAGSSRTGESPRRKGLPGIMPLLCSRKKPRTRKWRGPQRVTQAEGRPDSHRCHRPSTHPLSPLPGTRVLQGGEVCATSPLALLHLSPLRGQASAPCWASPLPSGLKITGARTGVAGPSASGGGLWAKVSTGA